MSAIGDYIHFSAKEYEIHGTLTHESGDSNFDNVETVFNNNHNKIREKLEAKKNSSISEKEQKELGQAIEKLMKPSGEKDQLESLNQLWNNLIKVFQDDFDGVTGEILRETGNVIDRAEILESNLSRIKTKKGQGSVQLSTVLKRTEQLSKLINDIPQKTKTKIELLNKLTSIYEELEKLTNLKREELARLNITDNKIIKDNVVIKNKMYTLDRIGGVIKNINDIVGTLSGTTNLQKGTLFEYMIAVAPLVAGYQAVTSLDEYIKNSVVGNERTSVEFKESNFIKGVNFKQVVGSRYEYKPNEQLYVSTLATQDKVDVVIDWNGKPVKISAKNVNLRGGTKNIHIVSSTSLLILLQNLDSLFVNHYLNIVTEHTDESIPTNLLNLAHKNIKPTILLEALEGHKETADKAEIFIVNDNQTGEVKVFDIPSLVLKVMNHLNNIDNYVEIKDSQGDISNITIQNAWANTYNQRITNVLANVHAHKISASLNIQRL